MGKGTGDLYIKCFSSDRIIFSKTFVVEDCVKYIQGTATYIDPSTATVTNIPNLTNYKLECDFNSPVTRNNRLSVGAYQTKGTVGVGFSYGNQALTGYVYEDRESSYGNTVSAVANTDYHFVVERRGTSVTLKYNNTTLASNVSVSQYTGDTIPVMTWDNRTLIKDLKVKPL